MTFGVDPDTHIDSLEHAKSVTIEGTSKWSCKLSITGKHSTQQHNYYYYSLLYPYSLCNIQLTLLLYTSDYKLLPGALKIAALYWGHINLPTTIQFN